MRRHLPPHRVARHHLLLHRPAPPRTDRRADGRAGGPGGGSARLPDLILAVLGVALLGGLALLTALALTGRPPLP